MNIPPEVHVDIDSREKYPIPFPSTIILPDFSNNLSSSTKILKVITHTATLKTGDYRLSDYHTACVIERKASQSELYNNLFNPQDSIRQAKAFKRLSLCCDFPYLLIECSPSEILKPNGKSFQAPIPPELILHRITVASAKYNFRTLWIPKTSSFAARQNTGRLLLHTMLSHAIFNIAVPEGTGVDSVVGSIPPSLPIVDSI